MNRKKFLIEKLKDRVLYSLNEDSSSAVKTGERWFYEPFNVCIRNLQDREPNLKLSGGSACYTRVNGDSICFESRHSGNQKGGYFLKPGHVLKYIEDMKKTNPKFNPSLFDLHKYDIFGEWWCESGTKEPKVDLTKTIEHRKRMEDKEKNLNTDFRNTTSGSITQAKTMDDVKNGKGYIIKGMRGPLVKELQKMLLTLKYDLGLSKDDSIFGENTKNALEQFQKDNGIIPKNNIYGVFGKITHKKMMEKLSNL